MFRFQASHMIGIGRWGFETVFEIFINRSGGYLFKPNIVDSGEGYTFFYKLMFLFFYKFLIFNYNSISEDQVF